MAKIDTRTLAGIYKFAKLAYLGSISQSQAIEKIHELSGMNKSSATDYVRNLKHLLEGQLYQRTLNAASTRYFLESIRTDENLLPLHYQNALSALAKHIPYYERVSNSNSITQREILYQAGGRLHLYDETLSNTEPDDAIENSLNSMYKNAKQAHLSSGKSKTGKYKVKSFTLGKKETFKKFATKLLKKQKGHCNISGLKLQFEGTHSNSHMLCSLDRICSAQGYEYDNLQIICRFINNWKSDMSDNEFRELIGIVRGH